MRILHTGDLHIGITSTRMGKPTTAAKTREKRLEIIKYVIQQGIAENVDIYAIPGDIFDKSQPYPQDYADLIEILEVIPKDKHIFMVYGNHDEPTSKGLGLSVIQQSRFNKLHVAFGLKQLVCNTYNFILAPWGSKLEDIREQMLDNNILLFHAGVKDENHHWVELEGEEGNYHLDDLWGLGCKAIMLGHYHNQQELAPGIWYSGSVDNVHGFSEENDVKGALLWDIGKEITVTPISTAHLVDKYKTFKPDEFLEFGDEFDGYVRVKGEVDEKERLTIIKKLADFKCLDYKIDLVNKVKKNRVFRLEGRSDNEILTNYFKQKNVQGIKELLKLDKELSI
jgi:DNA repair exonuclease SbcCD nuclease subunit